MNFIIVFSVLLAATWAQEKEGYKFEIQHEHPHIYQHVQNHGDQKEGAVSTKQNDDKHVTIDHQHHEAEHYVDYMGHPKYHFDYAVHDPHTHDIKNQWEMRDGKQVKGEYKVVQPDGKTRVVQYESDGHGTNYHVKYEGGHY